MAVCTQLSRQTAKLLCRLIPASQTNNNLIEIQGFEKVVKHNESYKKKLLHYLQSYDVGCCHQGLGPFKEEEQEGPVLIAVRSDRCLIELAWREGPLVLIAVRSDRRGHMSQLLHRQLRSYDKWRTQRLTKIDCPRGEHYEKNRKCIIPEIWKKETSFAKYGGRNIVTALTGDGVGPELLKHVEEIFRYAGAPVNFEEVEINASTTDPDFMHSAMLSVERNGVAIKGNIETIHDSSRPSMNVHLRTELGLFGNIVAVKSIPGIPARHDNIDMILIRENTEGEYTNLEHENVSGVIESLKIITAEKSTNIAKYAFEIARKHGRKKVTAVHKANIMKLGDGLFLNCCRKVSEDYPEIDFNDMIIDNASMQMVSRPQQFDVLVMPNLYGNILSNIAAGLVGGPGVVAGVNVGNQYAVFEMGTRQTGKSLKGKNIANPVGLLLAGCDMLDYLGHAKHASLIRDSVMTVLSDKKVHTPDLGGEATTVEVVQAVIDELKPRTRSWSEG